MNMIERFWAKVEKGPYCWIWTGTLIKGYGSFKLNHSDWISAHRFSWQVAYGEIPPGLFILHRCDVPRCVRPDHLFIGTQRDNIRDAHSKGRGRAKLTVDDVMAIRASSSPSRMLARFHGVSYGTIRNIRARRAWSYVPGQSLTEFALILPVLIVLITGIFALAILFHDWAQADSSAHNAVHAAAIHVVDGSGLSCQDRAQAALGEPIFLMATAAYFEIQPCSSEPYWIGAPGARVTGTWHFTVNPPVPFIYGNFGFPTDVELRFLDTFR